MLSGCRNIDQEACLFRAAVYANAEDNILPSPELSLSRTPTSDVAVYTLPDTGTPELVRGGGVERRGGRGRGISWGAEPRSVAVGTALILVAS